MASPVFDRVIIFPRITEVSTDPFGQTHAETVDYNNPRARIWAERKPVPIRDQQPTTANIADFQVLYSKFVIRGFNIGDLAVGDYFRDDQGDEWEIEGLQEIERRRYYEIYGKVIR